ncbi:Na+-driven multidrug efflux pump [Treponema sp. JC4]|uniref:MATE family efflux transporter n=1 Tax=Treponema sp. JC4 TaxID=1124982 RepID=UPI00025B0E90|nr:MATE family efflux transporter [Treponema sp. JC4]EID84105.1 Na+-driven multidrug efflux pump [Treponema sp. JC4]
MRAPAKNNFKRSSTILFEKFIRYLLPSMLTTAAFSLSEFADSMLVSNLLGQHAMAIIQLGFPFVMIASTACILIGNGGSTLYSIALGERNREKAGKIFVLSMLAALVLGLIIYAIEFSFFNPLASLVCKEQELLPEFKSYLFVLLFSSPVFILFLAFVFFLPPSGAPFLATLIHIIANVVNILMDYVYIHIFNLGVQGAAWATLTGYITAIIFTIIALKILHVDIRNKRPEKTDLAFVKDIAVTGSPFSINQLGFAIKFSFLNSFVAALGGTTALVAFSLCVQSISIVTIFIGAVLQSTLPLIAVLHGQKDYQGERRLLKISYNTQFIFSLVCALYFIILPKNFAFLYDIKEGAALSLADYALRIFSLQYFIRGFYLIFMPYSQILGHKFSSLFISIFDGFGGNILLSLLLCRFIGLDGIWWSFPATSFILFIFFLLLQGRFQKEHETPPLLDITIINDDKDISEVSKKAQDTFISAGLDSKTALKAALLIEETALFTKNRTEKNGYLDVLTALYQDRVEIDFRSIGATGNIDEKSEKDIEENIRFLKSISDKIQYDFIMGMSTMRVIINKKG